MNTNSLLFLCYTLFFCALASAQNLAPNASFEEVNFVDDQWSGKFQDFEEKIREWSSPNQGSPDLLDNRYLSVMSPSRPGLLLTDVQARTGSKSIGIKTYGCENKVMHCREYLQVKLDQQVPRGKCISYEYWVSRTSTSILTNNFGAVLSDTLIWQPGNRKELDLSPVTSEHKIVGEVPGQWYRISGEIYAPKNCEYFLIGNFFEDHYTEFMIPKDPIDYSFYLIDDVSVTMGTCSDTILEKRKLTLGNIMFKFDSWEITDVGRTAIKKFLSEIGEEIHGIQIVGHTDGVGTEEYNQRLSERRALTAKDVFVGFGVPGGVIQHKGIGTQELIAEPTSAENRRVEITIE